MQEVTTASQPETWADGSPKDAKVSQKAAKGASQSGSAKGASQKAPKSPTASPTAKVNSKGQALRCTVKMGPSQCQNPARWPHGKGATCTTHHKAIMAGRTVQHVLAPKVVNVSLWGIKVKSAK